MLKSIAGFILLLRSNMNRKTFLGNLALSTTAIPLSASGFSKPRKRPNIVWILSDQHDPDALSFTGKTTVHTPHMDRLRREGAAFTSTYCASPVCGPSRVALLTAEFPSSNGVLGNQDPSRPESFEIPRGLRNAGYETVHIGKTHLGVEGEPGTAEFANAMHQRGFTDECGTHGKIWAARLENDGPYGRYLRERGLLEAFADDYAERKERRKEDLSEAPPSALPKECYHDYWIRTQSLEWINGYKEDNPFFSRRQFRRPPCVPRRSQTLRWAL